MVNHDCLKNYVLYYICKYVYIKCILLYRYLSLERVFWMVYHQLGELIDNIYNLVDLWRKIIRFELNELNMSENITFFAYPINEVLSLNWDLVDKIKDHFIYWFFTLDENSWCGISVYAIIVIKTNVLWWQIS